MIKTIDTLIEDIESLFVNGQETHEELLESFGADCSEMVKQSLEGALKGTRPFSLRLSAVGKKPRQVYYDYNRVPREEFSGSTLIKFQYGHLLESFFIYLAKEAGHTVTREQEEVSVDGVLGHIDCIIDGVLVDVKSASSFSFAKFKRGTIREDDAFGYIPQLAAYSKALGGLDAAFWAIDKVSGAQTLCKFDKEELETVDVSGLILGQKKAVEATKPPKKCYSAIPEGKSGNMKLGVNCSYCSFKEHCWKEANDGIGLRTFLYSGGRPVFLTEVVREPRVPEVI